MSRNRRIHRQRIETIKQVAAIVGAIVATPIVAVAGAILLMPQDGFNMYARAFSSQTVQLIAETYSGDVHILGEGDTCGDAWTNHAPIPTDWREVRCN